MDPDYDMLCTRSAFDVHKRPPIGKKIGRVPGVWDPRHPIYQLWVRFGRIIGSGLVQKIGSGSASETIAIKNNLKTQTDPNYLKQSYKHKKFA